MLSSSFSSSRHNEQVLHDSDDEYSEEPQDSMPQQPTEHDRNLQLIGSSYRRPSIAQGTLRPAFLSSSPLPASYMTQQERERVVEDEASLLRDNHIIPSKRAFQGLSWQKGRHGERERERRRSSAASESERLLSSRDGTTDGPGYQSLPTPDESDGSLTPIADPTKAWEESVAAGKIHTSWYRETKVLGKYSGPLVVTFLLQYSLTVASVFSVGRLGKEELAACSLASMTSNITGYAIYQGLATSLDTLCAQAYGSGKLKLVGLHFQRCLWLLMAVTIPIGAVWISGEWILQLIVPEKEVARLAGAYLRVLLIGAPGYAAFEAGKRFVQAQGIFFASTLVLLICAPINAVLNYLLVWHPTIGFGFLGAPTAVAIVDWLMVILLALYVAYVRGSECWGGWTRRAFKGWMPMLKLALPGVAMVESEFLAFEILTLAASRFGTAYLAAQSVLGTVTSLTFQAPFALSIAASTRVANFLGATLGDAARLSSRVAIVIAVGFGLTNSIVLVAVRHDLAKLFTNDTEVINLVAKVMPLCATFQLVDALAAVSGGILRGQGRQYIGGWVNLLAYYAVGMPFSLTTAFALGWELFGLWSGVSIALMLVSIVEIFFIIRTDWQHMVEQAKVRTNEV